MKNEKGFTIVEVLVSMFILMLAMTASFQFFESYKVRSAQIGEYDTARLLAINGMENEILQTKNGDTFAGTVFEFTTSVNGEAFKTIVTRQNVTDEFDFINNQVEMYELASIVTWRDKQLEVKTYVSEEH